jgi:hypothetical protein
MKKIVLILVVFSLFSCEKEILPTPTQDLSNNNHSITKNYLSTSYELQKSNIKIDLMELRSKYGVNSGWNIMAYAFVDVNDDGNDDIFMNSSYGESLRTYGEFYIYKNGDYIKDTTTYFTERPSMIHPRKVLVGDYNKDGRPDIFITGHGYDYPPFPGEFNELLLSNNNGKYNLVKFDKKVGFYHGACSGDIDNDGDLDIFVLGGSNTYFLINNGKGEFSYSTNQIDVNLLNGYGICEFVDIDKDGYLDLMVGGGDVYNSARIYWGNPNFSFSISNKTEIPNIKEFGSVTDMDIFDLDDDNKNELIITRTGFDNFYNGWYVQILSIKNKESLDVTNSFIEKNSYLPTTPNNQEWIPWVRFDDYDNNGKIDFFSTKCTNLPMVRWELQNGKLIRIN